MQIKIYALGRDLIVSGEYQPFRRTTKDEPGQSEYFFVGKITDANTKKKFEPACTRHKEVIVRACLDQIYTQQQLLEEAWAIDDYENNRKELV